MTQIIQPLGEHEVVVLLLQLCLLLATARGLGLVAQRFGLPSVVGELLAGVVLGPSLLGALAPGMFHSLVPQDPAQFHLLEVVSLLGVLMLLVVTGMETDLGLIASRGRSAAMISLFGIVVPFGTGVFLGQFLPADFVADPSQRLVFSLFLGTAMGISAIPVIAKVLIEMGVVRRDIGQVTLAAGMIDDTIGWILLSMVAGLARSGSVDLAAIVQSVVSVIAVVGLGLTVGRRMVDRAFRLVDIHVGGDAARLTLLMVLLLAAAALTHQLRIEAVLGAFLIGIVVGQVRRFGRQSRHIFETVTLGVFAPIFFAASGLRVDLTAMADPTVLGVGLVVLTVAILGKFVGAALGGRLSGMGRWECLSLGAGMNARGAIEIIVATVGLGLGILTQEMYTIVLMVAIVTSLMAPPILRATLQRVPMSAEEEERLARDDRRRVSFLANTHRVLLPTRGGRNSWTAASLLSSIIHDEQVEVTTMSVLPPRDRVDGASGEDAVQAAEASLDALDEHLSHLRPPDRRRLLVHRRGPVHETIVAEAAKGYDLVVLGASEPPDAPGGESDSLLGDIADRAVQEIDTPVLLVRTPADRHVAGDVRHVGRILVPTTGTGAGRRATELAAAIARHHGAHVVVLHVVTARERVMAGVAELGSRPLPNSVAEELVDLEAAVLGEFGVTSVTTVVEQHRHVDHAILDVAGREHVDLIILSASRRSMSERAFLGHHTESVLRSATCTVAVVS